jgi:hypothetical protein
MAGFRVMPLDIETAPMEAFIWDGKVEYVGHDMVEQHTTVLCASYRDPLDKKIKTTAVSPSTAKTVRNDRAVCKKVHDLLTYCGEENIIVLAQNGDRFDLPKLKARFIYYRFRPLPPISSIDTLKLLKQFRFDYNRLDFIDKHLHGIGKVETRGFPMWRDIISTRSTPQRRKQAMKEMLSYCEGDILALERTYETLEPYVTLPHNMNLWQRTYDKCPSCGKDGLRYAEKPHFTKTRAYRRMSCKYCRKWCTETMSLKDWTAQPTGERRGLFVR